MSFQIIKNKLNTNNRHRTKYNLQKSPHVVVVVVVKEIKNY
jgi:hypothetical protein